MSLLVHRTLPKSLKLTVHAGRENRRTAERANGA